MVFSGLGLNNRIAFVISDLLPGRRNKFDSIARHANSREKHLRQRTAMQK